MDLEFNSQAELRKRLLPALRVKVREIKKLGIRYINENDIWNYLVDNKWKNGNNLYLCDLVNDILRCDYKRVDDYIKSKLENNRRYFEDLEIIWGEWHEKEKRW